MAGVGDEAACTHPPLTNSLSLTHPHTHICTHPPPHPTPRSGDTFLSQDQVVPYCMALLEVFRCVPAPGRMRQRPLGCMLAVCIARPRASRAGCSNMQHAALDGLLRACPGRSSVREVCAGVGAPARLLAGRPAWHALPAVPAGTMARATTGRRRA